MIEYWGGHRLCSFQIDQRLALNDFIQIQVLQLWIQATSSGSRFSIDTNWWRRGLREAMAFASLWNGFPHLGYLIGVLQIVCWVFFYLRSGDDSFYTAWARGLRRKPRHKSLHDTVLNAQIELTANNFLLVCGTAEVPLNRCNAGPISNQNVLGELFCDRARDKRLTFRSTISVTCAW